MWSFVQILIWGIFWAITGPIVAFARRCGKKPRRDNCLTWAVRRWDQEGGYIVLRWSRGNKYKWLRWVHFLWLPADKHQDLVHFIPKVDDQYFKALPEMYFDGKVRKGDNEDEIEN